MAGVNRWASFNDVPSGNDLSRVMYLASSGSANTRTGDGFLLMAGACSLLVAWVRERTPEDAWAACLVVLAGTVAASVGTPFSTVLELQAARTTTAAASSVRADKRLMPASAS